MNIKNTYSASKNISYLNEELFICFSRLDDLIIYNSIKKYEFCREVAKKSCKNIHNYFYRRV